MHRDKPIHKLRLTNEHKNKVTKCKCPNIKHKFLVQQAFIIHSIINRSFIIHNQKKKNPRKRTKNQDE